MVLAEAFMKRNDLKKQIANLTKAATQNLWEDKSLPVNFTDGTKINPTVAYNQIGALMAELQNLNVAITKANVTNSVILRDLETTTARIALIEQILQRAECYPGDKVREPNYGDGERLITENRWLISAQSLQLDLKEAQEHKRDLEKTLAHNNFVTEVVL